MLEVKDILIPQITEKLKTICMQNEIIMKKRTQLFWERFNATTNVKKENILQIWFVIPRDDMIYQI